MNMYKFNKSILLQYLGYNNGLKVLDFLIDNHFFDFPLTEIARGSNVSYNSLTSFFSEWLAKEIIIKTRRIGKSDYYQINIKKSMPKLDFWMIDVLILRSTIDMKNSFVSNIIKLDWSLTKKTAFSGIEEKEVIA